MKVLITGSSGIGKSTAIKELKRRGFTAYDTDDLPRVTRLEIKETGQPVEWPKVKEYMDWDYYAWNWQESGLKKLLASDDDVFIAAIVHNQADFYQLFDRIVVLTVDLVNLRSRIENRTRHPFGHKNIEQMLRNHPSREAKLIALGAIPIDGSGPVEKTVDAVLAAIQK